MKRTLAGIGTAFVLAGAATVALPAAGWADTAATCSTSTNYKTVKFTCDAPNESRKVEVKLECIAFGVPVTGQKEIVVPGGSGYWQEMYCPEGAAVGDYGWWDRGAA